MLFKRSSGWREDERANSGPSVPPSKRRPGSRRCALNATTVAGLIGTGRCRFRNLVTFRCDIVCPSSPKETNERLSPRAPTSSSRCKPESPPSNSTTRTTCQ